MEDIKINCHSSIKISGEKIIYIDPFKIEAALYDADFIFCTHSHYDHFSPEDIKKVINDKTVIIVPNIMVDEVKKIFNNVVYGVLPNNEYNINGISFKTTFSYNINKPFHPKENNWVGYIINLDKSYYIAGDTDNISELQNLVCDVAFLPVGGTYTMDCVEASKLANSINSKIIIPTHYGSIVGNKNDGKEFSKLILDKDVELLL